MKFLECPTLSDISLHYLNNFDLGDRIISGVIEAYSCKMAGQDKKISKEIETKILNDVERSPEISSSPLGSLKQSSTRKLLINIIQTMNASLPDYDFSNISPEQFIHIQNALHMIEELNAKFVAAVDQVSPGFKDKLWSAIDETIDLEKSEIYTFVPTLDDDSYESGALWTFFYFFYNKKQKKILFFMCCAQSKLHLSQTLRQSPSEESWTVVDEKKPLEPANETAYIATHLSPHITGQSGSTNVDFPQL